MKTACAYIRVSTEHQEELSPDSQRRLLKEYASKNNILLSSFYSDLGISGRRVEQRPDFQRMLLDCKSKEHPYDMVLVWKFSRFARNQEESILYKSILKKHNVEVVSISETVPDGLIGGLIERIFEFMDEQYSVNLSGEAKRGWEEKRLQGGYPASCPFGYDYQKDGIPTINEAEALIVRKIFTLYLYEDQSASAITRWLNQTGCKTKKGSCWSSQCLLSLLSNPFFAGKIRWKAYDEKKHLLPRSQWIIMEGRHTPIISMEEFEAAYQKRLEEGQKKHRASSGCKNWLSGLIKCHCCQHSLIYCKGSGRNSPYFRCRSYIHGLCSSSQYITEAQLKAAIFDGLRAVLLVSSPFVSCPPASLENSSSFLSQLRNAEKKLYRAKQAYLNGADTLEEYKNNKLLLEEEKKRLVSCAKKASAPQPSLPAKPCVLHGTEDILSLLDAPDFDFEKKREALCSICEKIEYDKSSDTLIFHLFL